MKIAVIGAGLMGRAAMYDLARTDGVKQVGLFDVDAELARQVAGKYGNERVTTGRLDAADVDAATEILREYDAALSCVTYKYNPGLTRAAIDAHCSFADLGGNHDVVRTQMELDDEARRADVVVIPDCGLAPGMVSILVADGVARFDSVSSIKIRVGGLPQVPRPPLNYQVVFSAEGLINEYWEPCTVLENGKKKQVNPMTGLELLEFDGVGKLEAFYTSGGASTLPDTYAGQVDFLDYKTIRYPGHCQLFRPMLEIGLGSPQPLRVGDVTVAPREIFKAVLDKNLNFREPDMVLARLTIEGEKDDRTRAVIYEIVDRQDSRSGLTAMMRTTAFPAAIVTWMAAAGHISVRGCQPQEIAVNPSMFITQLRKRGINLQIKE